ncbi:MAG: magnesium/cobalt transporter CorA [Planctomycetes bacterium]|nr:magnesium/cobalt transporter CorA [Planctomycetota bacterium]
MAGWKDNLGKTEHKRRRRQRHRVAKNKPPAGSSPGTLVLPEGGSAPRIRATRYTAESHEVREIRDAQELANFCRPDGFLWIDVQGLGDRSTLEWIGKNFGLHPLVLADIVHVPQRPKCEAYAEETFLVTRRLRWKGDAHDPVDERQVSLVLGKRHVLSFQEGADDVLDPVRARLEQGTGKLRGSGPDYLVYALLDAIVDEYLPILDKLGLRLEELEERVVEQPTRALLRELAALRHDLIAIRRDVWPQREALHALLRGDVGGIGEPVKIYLRDVHDHCVQVAEMVEVYREIASGLLNIYMTSIANRTNEVMKVLTVMSTIFIPLTFLVGVWGMNFAHMPELGWRFGYLLVWLFMLVLAGVLFAYFRRRGWIGREPD